MPTSAWMSSWTLPRSGPCSVERGHAEGQRRRQQRRAERRHDRLPRRAHAGGLSIGGRVQDLAPRAHDGALLRHVDADRVRLAVAIACVGLDPQQVVAGQLRFDALEQGLSRAGHREQRAARRARQHLEPFGPRLPIPERVQRHPAVRDVEDLVLQLERVEARPRLRRQGAEIQHHRFVGEHEAFRDEHHRLRRVDPAEADEQVAEAPDRLVGVAGRVLGQRARFDLDLPAAPFERPRRRTDALALAVLHGGERGPIAVIDRLRFDERDVVARVHRPRRLLAAGHPRDRLLDARAVRGEKGCRRAGAEARHGHAVRGRQPIDERIRRLRDGLRAAEPDVRLVHGEHDEASARRALVRAVAVRRRRRVRRCRPLAHERHPFRGRHAAPVAVDADGEIIGREIGDRLAAVVDDGDVERGHIDRELEARRLRRLLRGNHRGDTAHDRADRDKRGTQSPQSPQSKPLLSL